MNRREFTTLCAGGALLVGSKLLALESAPKGSEIFLTIDDGWFHRERVLEIADYYKVPLNLFIIGKIIELDPKVWSKALDKGHLLGSHSYNHHKLSKIGEATAVNDFKLYKKAVVNSLGKENYDKIKFFRYPYGDRGNKKSSHATKSILADNDWRESWWSMDLSFSSAGYGVKAYQNPLEQLNYFKKNIKTVNVPLFHFKDPDIKAIELIIEYGLNNGHKFLRLDDKKASLNA